MICLTNTLQAYFGYFSFQEKKKFFVAKCSLIYIYIYASFKNTKIISCLQKNNKIKYIVCFILACVLDLIISLLNQ